MIRAIMACDLEGGVGKNGTIPWHIPEDLKIFKAKTNDSYVVMGSRTWNDDMLPKPLVGRKPIVLSSQFNNLDGNEHIDMVINAPLNNVKDKLIDLATFNDVWICGGGQVYNSLLDIIDEFHISFVNDVYDCDTFFDVSTVYCDFIELTERTIDSDEFTHKVFARENRP